MSVVSKLTVDDEEFLVASLIDRCPRVMMLRELCQNAFDAATMAEGIKEVRIGVAIVDGVRKLRIWNTGPGMDPVALHAMCDLSSSIGKLKSLDRNFGIGAKVASLPSNPLGLRYRSCANGRAYEVMLGKRNGVYGRLMRPDTGKAFAHGRMVEIIDVSEEILAAGGDLDFDWTEVVLLGMRPEQDTSLDPYDGNPAVDPRWIPNYLFRRYGRIPKGIKLYIEPILQGNSEARVFEPLLDRRDAYALCETVEASDGLKIHFLHDPAHPQRPWENKSTDGALHATTTMLAVCWRDELFDVQQGSSWIYEAPRYGVVFGARHLNVIIELPGDYPVIPEMYRQFLQYRGDTQGHVRALDFSGVVMKARPRWVMDLAPKGFGDRLGRQAGKLSDELTDLVAKTHFKPPESALKLEAEPSVSTSDQTRKFVVGVIKACGVEPVLLRDPEDIRDRWLQGRAAVYYPETHQVFINMLYEAREAFLVGLTRIHREGDDDLAQAQKREDLADFYFVRRIMRALIHGLSKANNSVNWQDGHVSRAVSPEALSTAADDLDDQLGLAMIAARAELA